MLLHWMFLTKRAQIQTEETSIDWKWPTKRLAQNKTALSLAHSRQKNISDLGILAATEASIGELISASLTCILEDREDVIVALLEERYNCS